MSPIRLVLDTNVVLDWLVFEDRCVDVLRQQMQEGRILVMTSLPAIDELCRVLAYPQLGLDAPRQKALIDFYRVQTTAGILPEGFSRENLLLPAEFPRCRDADDQHFLALAYHAGVDALVSKDKAMLRLRKRAEKFGLRILDLPQLRKLLG